MTDANFKCTGGVGQAPLRVADHHEALHVIDTETCSALIHCTRMINAAWDVGLKAELQAVVEAVRRLNGRAGAIHLDIHGEPI